MPSVAFTSTTTMGHIYVTRMDRCHRLRDRCRCPLYESLFRACARTSFTSACYQILFGPLILRLKLTRHMEIELRIIWRLIIDDTKYNFWQSSRGAPDQGRFMVPRYKIISNRYLKHGSISSLGLKMFIHIKAGIRHDMNKAIIGHLHDLF